MHHFPIAVAKVEDHIADPEVLEDLDAANDVLLCDGVALGTAQDY